MFTALSAFISRFLNPYLDARRALSIIEGELRIQVATLFRCPDPRHQLAAESIKAAAVTVGLWSEIPDGSFRELSNRFENLAYEYLQLARNAADGPDTQFIEGVQVSLARIKGAVI